MHALRNVREGTTRITTTHPGTAPTHTQTNTHRFLSRLDMWEDLLECVRTQLGRVLLACPLGSQRYNLDVPGKSDMDFYVVYQARYFRVRAHRASLGACVCERQRDAYECERRRCTILSFARARRRCPPLYPHSRGHRSTTYCISRMYIRQPCSASAPACMYTMHFVHFTCRLSHAPLCINTNLELVQYLRKHCIVCAFAGYTRVREYLYK